MHAGRLDLTIDVNAECKIATFRLHFHHLVGLEHQKSLLANVAPDIIISWPFRLCNGRPVLWSSRAFKVTRLCLAVLHVSTFHIVVKQ